MFALFRSLEQVNRNQCTLKGQKLHRDVDTRKGVLGGIGEAARFPWHLRGTYSKCRIMEWVNRIWILTRLRGDLYICEGWEALCSRARHVLSSATEAASSLKVPYPLLLLPKECKDQFSSQLSSPLPRKREKVRFTAILLCRRQIGKRVGSLRKKWGIGTVTL